MILHGARTNTTVMHFYAFPTFMAHMITILLLIALPVTQQTTCAVGYTTTGTSCVPCSGSGAPGTSGGLYGGYYSSVASCVSYCAPGFKCPDGSQTPFSIACPNGTYCPPREGSADPGTLTPTPCGGSGIGGGLALSHPSQCSCPTPEDCGYEACTVRVYAGGGRVGSVDGEGFAARFNDPRGLDVDATTGMLYVCDYGSHSIRSVSPLGKVVTLAGTANTPGHVDAVGTFARLSGPYDLDFSLASGSPMLYILEKDNNPSASVRVMNLTSMAVTSLAGGGSGKDSLVDGIGTVAVFNSPQGISVDSNGTYAYVADTINHVLRRVTIADGTVITLSGMGNSPGWVDSTNSTLVRFNSPVGIDIVGTSLYVSEYMFNKLIRVVSTVDGSAFTLAGDPTNNQRVGYSLWVDGVGFLAQFNTLEHLAVEPSRSSLVVVDSQNLNIRRVTLGKANTGVATFYAGDEGHTGNSDNVNWRARNSAFAKLKGVAVHLSKVFVSEAETSANGHQIKVIDCTPGAAAAASVPFATWPNTSQLCAYRLGLTTGPCAHPLKQHSSYMPGYLSQWDGNVWPATTISYYSHFRLTQDTCGWRGKVVLFPPPSSTLSNISIFLNEVPATITPFASDGSAYWSIDTTAYVPPFSIFASVRVQVYSGSQRDSTTGLVGSSWYLESWPSIIPGRFCPNAAVVVPPGYYLPPGSTSAANVTICPIANFCPGGSPGSIIPCFPATACTVPGLSFQPTCYWNTSFLAGNGVAGYSNGIGTQASFSAPNRIVLDSRGDFVFVDTNNHLIRKVTPAGTVSVLAGSGIASYFDLAGTNAGFNRPFGIDLDYSGNFIIADHVNHRIRMLSPFGNVTTIAGSGASSFLDGAGPVASFKNPIGVSVSSTSMLFVADFINARIRRITPLGLVSTFAGSGAAGWADGLSISAVLNSPNGITVDKRNDNLFWPDMGSHRIRKATPAGFVSTLAGNGASGYLDGSGTFASFQRPRTVAIWENNLLVADGENNRIRMITPTGIVTTLLGSGTASSTNGWGTTATFSLPHGLAVDSYGSVIIGEETGLYLRMASCVPCPASYSCSSGTPVLCPSSATYCTGQLWGTGISTSNGLDNQWKYSLGGDNSTLSASTFLPASLLSPPDYNLFPGFNAKWIGNPSSVIGWYTFTAPFSSSVGFTLNGTYSADNVPGRVIISPSKNFAILDQSIFYIQLGYFSITTTSASSSISFTVYNSARDLGLFASFTSLTLQCPEGSYSSVVSIVPLQATCAPCLKGSYCPKGTISPVNCPAGTYNNLMGASRISSCLLCSPGSYSTPGSPTCSLCPSGVYGSTFGLFSPACTGDCTASPGYGCPAGSTSPSNVTQCVQGYFCPGGTPAFLTPCLPPTACPLSGLVAQPPCYWNVSTFVGSGVAGYMDGQGTMASMNQPGGIVYNPLSGQLIFADYANHRIRLISSTGNVSFLAGSGLKAFADGQGSAASFSIPYGVTLDRAGNAYIADAENHRIRVVSPLGLVTTFAGNLAGGADGTGTNARFSYPNLIAFDSSFANGFITEQFGARIRKVLMVSASVSTIAGIGSYGFLDAKGTQAMFNSPTCTIWHPSGVLFVADWLNFRIRLIFLSNETVTTFAGSSLQGGVNGVGTSASFYAPRGLTLDSSYLFLYVAEFTGGNRIRGINIANREVVTIAGSGTARFSDGFGLFAGFNSPLFLTVTPLGVLYVSDFSNSRIRQLTCVPCPASYSCSSGAPVLCPKGSFCPFNSLNPTKCPAMTYSATMGAASNLTCVPCPPFTYSSAGSANCNAYNEILWGVCEPVRYIKITIASSTFLNFGELEVLDFSASNIALGKPATQSSTYFESVLSFCAGAQPSGPTSAFFAVDGNLCTFSSTNSGTGEWWQVDLSSGFTTNTTILFYNRNDDKEGLLNANRMNSANLLFSDTSNLSITTVNLPATITLTYAIGYCMYCPVSYYCPSRFTLAPLLCIAGSYCPFNSSFPSICSPGTFSLAGASICTKCSAGTFSSSFGSLSCQKCTAGGYCPPGSTLPLFCPAGRYSLSLSASDVSTCLLCNPGSYSTPGSPICSLCPPGVFGSTFGLNTKACTGNCTAIPGYGCPAGSTSPSNVTQCLQGFYCPGGTPALYSPCSPSTACALPGLFAQPPCYWNVSTFAGSGLAGFLDGQGAIATFNNPHGLSFDANFLNLSVADYTSGRIRTLNPSGQVSTLAGNGLIAFLDNAFGPASSFYGPSGVTTDHFGNIYISDFLNNRIRSISPTGFVSSFIGSGLKGTANGIGTDAQLFNPNDFTFDSTFSLGFIVEQDGCRIRRVEMATGLVSIIAGNGMVGYVNAAGTNAQFNFPSTAIWHNSKLFISDRYNNCVRLITLASTAVTTFAGTPIAGGSDGEGTSATFNEPRGLAMDSLSLILYVSEWAGSRVRFIDISSRLVQTLAGAGITGFRDGFGTTALFHAPIFMDVSLMGEIFLSDSWNHRIRRLSCIPCPPLYNCSSGTPIRLSSTPSPTASFTTSPTPTISPTSTLTPTVSPSPTTSSTPTSSSTVTSTRTSSSTPTPSSSPSPTSSSSPTSSPTGTPSVSPTASNTPPPFSCLSRVNDSPPCKIPTRILYPPQLVTAAPPLVNSLSQTAPLTSLSTVNVHFPLSFNTTLSSSWPFIASSFSIQFPVSPSLGESVSVTCTPTNPLLSQVTSSSSPPYQLCTGTSIPTSCTSIPSASESDTLGVLTVNFTFSGISPIFDYPLQSTTASNSGGELTCIVASLPLATSSTAGLPLPHYGKATTLPPISTTLAPFSLPLLSAILLESSSTFGTFAVIGGGRGSQVEGASTTTTTTTNSPSPSLTFTLPPTYTFPCNSITSYISSSSATLSSVWTTPLVAYNCTSTATALTLLVDNILQPLPSESIPTTSAPPLATVIGGSRHLLLVASPLTPFQPDYLRVYLGTTLCTINYILPGGALASVTTPSLSSLCSSLNTTTTTTSASSDGDCGTFPLILLNSPPLLSIPSIYPPFQPTNDWKPVLTQAVLNDPTSPLAQVSSLVSLPFSTILSTTDVYTPLGTGIRIVSKCTDPTAAPPEDCVVINGKQPYLNSTSSSNVGKQCVWGSGNLCLPCPTGALCPGGEVLLPLPGYWVPSRGSPPSDLIPCPSPDTLLRCPGFQSIPSPLGIYGCGIGFKGQACAACDSGYYRDSGTCTTCPRTSLLSSILIPVLVFIGGLVGFGVVALAAVYSALLWCGGGRGVHGSTKLSLYDVAVAVAQLLLWVFLSAQGLASLFTQAQAVSPSYLIPLFKAASALQFKSIAADPSCYSSIPFLSFWLATISVVGAWVVGVGGGMVCYSRRPYRGLAIAVLTLSTLALTLGYGALTGIFSSAVICTFSSPMTISDYVNAKSDGRALQRAAINFGGGGGGSSPSITPSYADLKAASLNPTFASISGLARVLKATIPVSVLTSDPYQVCGEAAHAYVRPTAIAMTILYTAGLPFFGLWLLWAVGRLKGCRRKCCPAQRRFKLVAVEWKGGLKKGGSSLSSRPLSALLGLLLDPTLHPPKAWTGFFELWVLAVITGCVAVAEQSGLSTTAYSIAQGGVVVVSGLAIGVLSYGGKLYLPSHEWKRAIKCALYGVTGITAVFNGVLFGLQGTAFFSGEGKGKEWLSLVPLLLGGLVTILLLVSWWRSLFFFPYPAPTSSSTSGRGEELINLHANPMFTQPPPAIQLQPTPSSSTASPLNDLWVRHKDEDGDEYWHHPATGVSAWEVPFGGSTECGWVWEEVAWGEGGWVHELSGARTKVSPPASLGEVQGIIMAHLAELEAEKTAAEEAAAAKAAAAEPPSPPSTPPDRESKEPALSLAGMFQTLKAARQKGGRRKSKVASSTPIALEGEDLKRMFPEITEGEVHFYKHRL